MKLKKSDIKRLVEDTVRDFMSANDIDKLKPQEQEPKSYVRTGKKITADKEGTLGNLAKRMLSHDGAELKRIGSLQDVKEYIYNEVMKLDGTSDAQKKGFLKGRNGRPGILGARDFNQVLFYLSNVMLGADENGVLKNRLEESDIERIVKKVINECLYNF